jgi:hypothetical protein
VPEQSELAKIVNEFLGTGLKGALKAIFWTTVPGTLTPAMVSDYVRTAIKYLEKETATLSCSRFDLHG